MLITLNGTIYRADSIRQVALDGIANAESALAEHFSSESDAYWAGVLSEWQAHLEEIDRLIAQEKTPR